MDVASSSSFDPLFELNNKIPTKQAIIKTLSKIAQGTATFIRNTPLHVKAAAIAALAAIVLTSNVAPALAAYVICATLVRGVLTFIHNKKPPLLRPIEIWIDDLLQTNPWLPWCTVIAAILAAHMLPVIGITFSSLIGAVQGLADRIEVDYIQIQLDKANQHVD